MHKRIFTLLAVSSLRARREILFALVKIALWKVVGQRLVWIHRDGLNIRAGLRRGQGLWCALAGEQYEPELSWLLKEVRPGDCFLDLGANVGGYSLRVAKAIGSTGRVWAFEPNLDCANLLAASVQANGLGNIRLQQLGVSAKEGEAWLEPGDPKGKWNSLRVAQGAPGLRSIRIRTVTLDSFFAQESFSGRIFLKMDAEGQEENIVLGGSSFLAKHRPLIMLEVLKLESHRRLQEKLAGLGYVEKPPLRDFLGQPSVNRIFCIQNAA